MARWRIATWCFLGWLACAPAGAWAEPATVSEKGFTLGPEDVLSISVWKDESLTKEVVIRPDGYFSFPLVGDVQAEGRTVEDIKVEIIKRLAKFVSNPPVSVAVMKVQSYKVYVIGKVNRPGEFMVGHLTDVMQALSLAGGLTPFAAENSIKVLRRSGDRQTVFDFAYGEVVKGKKLDQNIPLQRWDVVMVP
jgi:polysaccharide export outer membrane protein